MTEAPAVAWQGRYLAAITRGKWEYVSRVGGIEAVVIVAIDRTDVILVEQFRVPLGRPCLELPAGLIGDQGSPEDVATSARRELEEETGYRADAIVRLGEYYSSPGMASEAFHLVRATGLTRVGEGGGDADENITVHRVPLVGLSDFVGDRRRAGVAIDVKLLLLLSADLLAE